ncbi:citrate lyase subunit alpha / citrate CoA-transferase [Candidatus Phytoplasma luffae]|uniref:Citrate lyase alpha chain n=1 Tax=Loofah witches'-broom phytoplasma TaxID=35773 RepID=A0A975ILR6_LOWBP|nr:citrate lyase subunit alpha [Candidatus Phytoplasma luffae]QTX02692.1 citrate lyase subunit alpha / citrate CoA-transferase [Candidatus Phytoplasma luffae]
MSNINNEILNKLRKNYNFEYNSFIPQEQKNFSREIKKNKIVPSLKEAIVKSGLKDGMTISFHHHFRHGDQTVEQVMKIIDQLNIKNLTISASSFTKSHECLVDYIKKGVIIGLEGSGLRGELGDSISEGILLKPAIIRSHGGRARAIMNRESKIDIAFLSVSSSDEMGNSNGKHGISCVGSLGYALVDAQYADKVIVITDNLVPYPNSPVSISQIYVDYVVKVDYIGDSSKIASNEIHTTFNPKEIKIAENIVKVITNTPYFKNNFSFQTGTGGASQASLMILKEEMLKKNIKASFFLGGIIKSQVEFLKQGLVDKLLDVQSFDLDAVQSIEENYEKHLEISSAFYANPFIKGCAVNKLNFGVLSALEIDVNFDCNVITGSDGYIRGASGGHSDVAFGSDISIVALPLIRGRIPSVTNKVNTIVTPGNTIDIVVTDAGIAVNPLRKDLIKILTDAQVPLKSIEYLRDLAYKITGAPEQIEYDKNKIVALIEYRDKTLIDVVYKIKPFTL